VCDWQSGCRLSATSRPRTSQMPGLLTSRLQGSVRCVLGTAAGCRSQLQATAPSVPAQPRCLSFASTNWVFNAIVVRKGCHFGSLTTTCQNLGDWSNLASCASCIAGLVLPGACTCGLAQWRGARDQLPGGHPARGAALTGAACQLIRTATAGAYPNEMGCDNAPSSFCCSLAPY
jgi:hypothetical protein